MEASINLEQIQDHLQSSDWESSFSAADTVSAKRIAHRQLLHSVKGEFLDTGDAEIVATVTPEQGDPVVTTVALWLEDLDVVADCSCSCAVQSDCEHAAALLFYLRKGERLAISFGEGSLEAEPQEMVVTETPAVPPASSPENPEISFFMELRRVTGQQSHDTLRSVHALCYVEYQGERFPLDPSGNTPAISRDGTQIKRDREAEMTALQTLYAYKLEPRKASEFARALARIENPEQIQWRPNTKQWPHPDLYWQRFRFQGILPLERRGWRVDIAPDVGHEPLIFKSENWKAEMVEEAQGWFNLSAGFSIDGEDFEIQPILATLLKHQFLEATEGMQPLQEFMVYLPDGRGLVLPVGRFRTMLTNLGEILSFKFTDGPIKMSKLEAAQLSREEDLAIEGSEELADLAITLQNGEAQADVAVPATLRATLRDYQLEGFRWMQFLASNQLSGVLADDMGLGKTLQTLTHLLKEIESGRSAGKPSLILAPTSVVVNWQREAAKFAPSLKILILQGGKRHANFASIAEYDLVLSSYALIHRDLEQHQKHAYHLLVLDEAQHIKNPGAQVSAAVRQLDASLKICLSGTPIENNLGELWAQFDFLMPGFLGSRETFNESFRHPIEKDHNEDKRQRLQNKLAPLILRRTKHDVAKELPPKTEIPHSIQLNEAQSDLYETVRAAMDKQVRQAMAARGQEAQIVFLDALLKLRQVCCHPALVNLSQVPERAQHNTPESAKLDYLSGMLNTLKAEGHKVLIFSQFTSMLDLIEAVLIEKQLSYLKLTGASKNRQEMVEEFQSGGIDVFLISLKAGGTGLTLTEADTIIHYDPWWNPAVENQATDRAYRIGQTKPVMVHKLICAGTVEERIQKMQDKKHGIANSILDTRNMQPELDDSLMQDLLGK
ncbi:DEAD/DEAH box helicase [Rubritalea marina]|uniref:DEAD/DEAH box helicase n=1 Tax=Rubritalea marina TaxID=361055 RepID=UPI00037CF2DE|nr:DEAD/DEAH box helicase [Rubritalea marina]